MSARRREAIVLRMPGHRRRQHIPHDGANPDSDGVSIISVRPNRSCIDLTTDGEHDYIDLTSPTQATGIRAPRVNNNTDESVLIVDSEPALRLDPILADIGEDERNVSETDEPRPDTSARDSMTSPPGKKLTCPICLDSDHAIFRSGRRLNSTMCGHVFCDECITMAIRSHHCCPTCRKKLTLKQIHPIFL